VAPVSIGITADDQDNVNFKVAAVRPDSPAANAGVQPDDVITALGGTKLTPANFLKVLARYKPADRVVATIVREGRVMNRDVTLAAPQIFDYRIEEDPRASAGAKAMRAAWLSGK
jgi:predicted metalloprotease with PDZ domain